MKKVLGAIGLLLLPGCGADALAGDGVLPEESVATAQESLAAGTLHTGDYLFAGQRLVAKNCYFHLEMQGDGNLVLYAGPNTRNPIWHSDRYVEKSYVVLQGDGNLVEYDPGGVARWWTGTVGTNANRLVVQDDGNLVLYNSTRAVWSSRTARPQQSWPCNEMPKSEATRLLRDQDMIGGDYGSFRHAGNASTCATSCAQDSRCRAFTHAPAGTLDPVYATCFLKESTPVPSSRTGFTSGQKLKL